MRGSAEWSLPEARQPALARLRLPWESAPPAEQSLLPPELMAPITATGPATAVKALQGLHGTS